MSDQRDAELRALAARSEPMSEEQSEQWQALQRKRKARVGDWSEAELEQAAIFSEVPPGRTRAQTELMRALLGAGQADRTMSLEQAARLLEVDPAILYEAAQEESLAVIRQTGEIFTSEARLGAFLLSSALQPGCEFAVWARLVFICGLSAGIRAAKLPPE